MSYKKVIRLVLVFTFLLINLSPVIAINTAEIWLLNDIKQQNSKNPSILEIGPAFGRLPIELFNNGFSGHYTAIDLSADHLEYLRTGLKKCPASIMHPTYGKQRNEYTLNIEDIVATCERSKRKFLVI